MTQFEHKPLKIFMLDDKEPPTVRWNYHMHPFYKKNIEAIKEWFDNYSLIPDEKLLGYLNHFIINKI